MPLLRPISVKWCEASFTETPHGIVETSDASSPWWANDVSTDPSQISKLFEPFSWNAASFCIRAPYFAPSKCQLMLPFRMISQVLNQSWIHSEVVQKVSDGAAFVHVSASYFPLCFHPRLSLEARRAGWICPYDRKWWPSSRDLRSLHDNRLLKDPANVSLFKLDDLPPNLLPRCGSMSHLPRKICGFPRIDQRLPCGSLCWQLLCTVIDDCRRVHLSCPGQPRAAPRDAPDRLYSISTDDVNQSHPKPLTLCVEETRQARVIRLDGHH